MRLPGGREVRVPATEQRGVSTLSQQHDMNQAKGKLSGRPMRPETPAGWKHGPAARREVGRHPLREPRPAPGVGGHILHF